jgi:hypothetical protein
MNFYFHALSSDDLFHELLGIILLCSLEQEGRSKRVLKKYIKDSKKAMRKEFRHKKKASLRPVFYILCEFSFILLSTFFLFFFHPFKKHTYDDDDSESEI